MVESRTIYSHDNLAVMRGFDGNSIDLIYLDPPFNSNHNYAAPLKSDAAGSAFKDTWTLSDIDEDWVGLIAEAFPALHSVIETAGKVNGDSDKAYMIYMAVRIMEMYRILKPTGMLYFHCDPTMSHSVKLMLDSIFGGNNFLNEVIWCYKSGGTSKKWFSKKHDIILVYTKTKKYTFNPQPEKSYMGLEYNTGNKNVELFDDKDGLGKYTLVNAKDWWQIGMLATSAKERTGYPTQKPLELLRKVIKTSSNEGDMVLDPFCGCATTCVAAEELSREWIGIDIDPLAAKLVEMRMEKELGLFGINIKNPHKPLPPVEKMSRNIKHVLFYKQKGVCNGCNITYPIQIFHLDHIVPKTKGGPNVDSNLQLLCGFCNSLKGDRSMDYLVKELKNRGVYNETSNKKKAKI